MECEQQDERAVPNSLQRSPRKRFLGRKKKPNDRRTTFSLSCFNLCSDTGDTLKNPGAFAGEFQLHTRTRKLFAGDSSLASSSSESLEEIQLFFSVTAHLTSSYCRCTLDVAMDRANQEIARAGVEHVRNEDRERERSELV